MYLSILKKTHLMSTETLNLLTELRKRLAVIALAWIVLFIASWHYDEQLLNILMQPLLYYVQADHLIATSALSPMMTMINLSAYSATLGAIPLIIWQFTRFLMPALYPHEKKQLIIALSSSLILLLLGISFAFFLVFPMLFDFLHQMMPSSIELLPDIESSLLTVTKLLLTCCLIFQTPIAIYFLLAFQWISPNRIRQLRPHIILSCLTLGMLLTPPDVLSQILLGVPLWLLIELGLATFVLCHKNKP